MQNQNTAQDLYRRSAGRLRATFALQYILSLKDSCVVDVIGEAIRSNTRTCHYVHYLYMPQMRISAY